MPVSIIIVARIYAGGLFGDYHWQQCLYRFIVSNDNSTVADLNTP